MTTSVAELLAQPVKFVSTKTAADSGASIMEDIGRVLGLGRFVRPSQEDLLALIYETGKFLDPPTKFDTEVEGNKIEDFHSAGCLVISDKNRAGVTALVIRRKGDDQKLDYGYGLPCGKREDSDKTVVDTAVRETFEEAQVMPRVIMKIPPFVAVEQASGKTKAVATFLAVSGIEAPASFEGESDEGKVTFMDPAALLYGPFGEYNKGMLAHFAPYIGRLPVPYIVPRYAQNPTFDFEVFHFTPLGLALYLAQPAGRRKLSLNMLERTLIRHTGPLATMRFVPPVPLGSDRLSEVRRLWSGGDGYNETGFVDPLLQQYLLRLPQENFVDTIFEGASVSMYFSSVLQEWVAFEPRSYAGPDASAYNVVKPGFFSTRGYSAPTSFTLDVTLRKLLAHHWALSYEPMSRAEHKELFDLIENCIGYGAYDLVQYNTDMAWGPSLFFVR